MNKGEYMIDEFGFVYHQYVDWKGEPVNRTPMSHSYSYGAYVVHKTKDDYKHTVYSDRLLQWDRDRHNSLCEKHFDNTGQYWDNRSVEKIQNFLRDYYDKQDLILVGIMKRCNVSNGYPYWIFKFDCDFD